MNIYEVVIRMSPKGDLNTCQNIVLGAFGHGPFGTYQVRKFLPTGFKVRITSDQFVKFFLLRREFAQYSNLKWDDVRLVKEKSDKEPFFDCTKEY